MPLFTRRRLQAMLDDLALQLDGEKARDLVSRLENKRVDQALPAEVELAILWGLLQLGEVDIEPHWWADAKRPDAYTEALVPGRAAVVEVTAPSDNSISGEDAMDGVAQRIGEAASRVRRGLGNFLYYTFGVESGYDAGVYYRRRLAPAGFQLLPTQEMQVRDWIESGEINRTRLRLVEPGLDVQVERKAYRQTRYHNIFSSMPPETHSLDDNPLFKALERKLDQLKGAPPETLRFLFLGDAGSTLLNRLGRVGEMDPTRRRVSGREILSHFVVVHSRAVDAVIVIAPVRERSMMGMETLNWRTSMFLRPGFVLNGAGLHRLLSVLPAPRFEGYQARSLFRQGLFKPEARGWSQGMSIQTRAGGPMQAKVSTRALLDLLAGRITVEQFRREIGERPGEKNLFAHWLDNGMTLQSVVVEPSGLDEDDDLLVLSFADDSAARALRVPKTSSPSAGEDAEN